MLRVTATFGGFINAILANVIFASILVKFPIDDRKSDRNM
jgi:hypothetical protein